MFHIHSFLILKALSKNTTAISPNNRPKMSYLVGINAMLNSDKVQAMMVYSSFFFIYLGADPSISTIRHG
jgi:hypothetical protein